MNELLRLPEGVEEGGWESEGPLALAGVERLAPLCAAGILAVASRTDGPLIVSVGPGTTAGGGPKQRLRIPLEAGFIYSSRT